MKRNIEKHIETDLNHLGLLVSDHVNAMLAYWDKDQICRFANKAYLEWFGKNRDEMIGKITLKELLGSLYEGNVPYITSVLAGQRQTFEREIATPLNGKKHTIANYYPHIVDGQVIGFFVHGADITTIKNLEKELVTLLEREKQLNEIKSRFVSTASHELRTPLSAIASSVSLLEYYNKSGEHDKMKKHFNRIGASIKNLVGILDDYLSLDKIEQNKIEIEYVNFNLPDFGNEIIQEITGILKEDQKIHYVHKGNKEIKQEKKILRNILLNLLSNAIKYSDKNEKIFLTTEVNKNKILINVHDNGIGISESDQVNLFQTFFRANNVVNIEGSGLGLTIVKRYVELIGGVIDLKSKINEGTTVYIELPVILS
jgi:PAS domain S-box-containing protein